MLKIPIRKLLLFAAIASSLYSYSQVHIQFIENKNQWNNNVLYKADIISGSIFLEDNCFTYCFYDHNDVHKCHHPSDIEEEHNHAHNDGNKKNMHFHAFKMHFNNSNINPRIYGNNEYPHYYNYFIGQDKSKWASKVKCYKGVNYNNIYNNIDIKMYNEKNNLKYDYIVKPGGNVHDINIEFEGVKDIKIIDGRLLIKTSVIDITEEKPFAYQIINGEKVQVKCEYKLDGVFLKFNVGRYNKNEPLIIDPVLMFSTYSGSYSNNFGYTASYDSKGHLYSGSTAFGPDYPTTLGAFQTIYGGDSNPSSVNQGTDIAITKWNLDGSAMIYSTLLGGNMDELPHSIFVNSEFELYVYGTTGSDNFPVTSNAYDQTYNGGSNFIPSGLGVSFPTGTDIIVAKLSLDGSDLLGSTYLGGSENDGLNMGVLKYNYADEVRGEIMLDNNHNVYIVSSTFSSNFPVTSGVLQNSISGDLDGCVTKLNNDLTTVIWSTYIGGTGTDAAYSITLDSNEDIYISGGTTSNDFPTTSGTLHPAYIGGMSDAFVTHISSNGQSILESSYFGSIEYDQAYFVELNGGNKVYLFGQTLASGSTLILNASYNTPGSGQFISVLESDLSTLIRSTVFGTGNGVNISPVAFLVDVCDKIYISGWGGGTNQPPYGSGGWTTGMETTSPTFQSTTDGSDFYLAVFEDDMSAITYGTFIGGNQSAEHVDGGTSRFSKNGKIYEAVCAGCWGNSDFPTSSGSWSSMNNNSCNLAVFKFDFMLPITIAEFPLPLHRCAPYTHTFDNLSQYANSYEWNFGDGTTSSDFEPTHVFDSVGTFHVTLTAFGDSSCNFNDSVVHIIYIHDIDTDISPDTTICLGESVILQVQSSEPNASYIYSSNPNFTDTLNPNINSGYYTVSPTINTIYYVFVNGYYCDAIDTVQVFVRDVDIEISPDTIVCLNDTADLNITNLIPSDTLSYLWNPLYGIISGDTTASPQVFISNQTTFYVTVTNQYGCETTDSVIVDVDDFSINANPVNVTCFGDCNGSISISPNGINPYTYEWSGGQSSSSISNLCPGNYILTVTDAIGCKQYFNTTITEPPLLIASITGIIHTQCDSINPNSGQATVTPSGGTPGYNYHWEDNQTDSTAINLYAHTYYVTITDSHGCDTVLSVVINDGSNLEISTNSISTTCYDYCDGSANVYIAVAGIPPYTYTWSNNSNLTNIDNLCAGYYGVSVIDDDFCLRFETVHVLQPDSIYLFANINPIPCFGDSTNATVQVYSGGTASYSYLWNTGHTDSVIYNITAGTYSVIVTDINNCKDTTIINVPEPPLLSLDSNVYPIICNQVCNGEINLTPIGGTPLYSYTWTNGANTPINNNLCYGNYSVTLTDNHGCTTTADFFVGVSDYIPPLDVTADDYHLYQGQSTGLHATNDNTYYYLWNPVISLSSAGIADPIATPDQTTTYEVYIIDQYGCTNIDTITIFISDFTCDEPYIYIPNAFSPNGDDKNNILYVQSNIIDELYFAVYNRWGEIMFETDDISQGWDGTYKGEAVDPAVFVYYMHAKCLDMKTFVKKGNVTLIR